MFNSFVDGTKSGIEMTAVCNATGLVPQSDGLHFPPATRFELADVCMAVSGSVSLELMYRAKPTVIVYRMGAVSLWLARRLVKLPYFTLVNLLAGEELFPEVATSADESGRIAQQLLRWLGDPAERGATVARLLALRDRVAVPGACDRAAEFLLGAVAKRTAA